jgi:hypothetical protein
MRPNLAPRLKALCASAVGCMLLLWPVAAAAAPRPAPATSHGVTTLAPSNGEGWQAGEVGGNPFTSVGVIGGHGGEPGADNLDGPDNGALAPLPLLPADAMHAAPPGKKAAAWLPEPATWLMVIVGIGMIGFALRGLIAARRRLKRLETPDA